MIPVLYILGTGRSGSTLLERMVAGYGRTVAVGELRYVWREGFVENRLCSCGEPFLSCPFWQSVHRRAEVLDPAFLDVARLVRRMEQLRVMQSAARLRWLPQMHLQWTRGQGFKDAWRASQSSLGTLYQAIHEASDGAVIIDSTKDTSYAHLLDSVPGFNIGCIHLVRDSRAVAFSWTRRKVRPEVTDAVATMARVSPWRSAVDWDMKYASASLLSMIRPGRVMALRYESLVQRPDQTLRSIDRFAHGLGMPSLGERAAEAPADRYHSVSGNPLRFDRTPLRLRLDDDWRTQMGKRDRAVVTALTAPLLMRHHMARLSKASLRPAVRSAGKPPGTLHGMHPSDAAPIAGKSHYRA